MQAEEHTALDQCVSLVPSILHIASPVMQTMNMYSNMGNSHLVRVRSDRWDKAASQAKVCDFAGVGRPVHQDVLGLQVPVQDALGMGILQPLQNLEHVELHGEQLINGRAFGMMSLTIHPRKKREFVRSPCNREKRIG